MGENCTLDQVPAERTLNDVLCHAEVMRKNGAVSGAREAYIQKALLQGRPHIQPMHARLVVIPACDGVQMVHIAAQTP